MTENGTLHQAVRQTAERNPSHPAIDDGSQVLSYRELLDLATGYARGLTSSADGTRVALVAHTDVHTYALYLAVLLSGRTVVPIDAGLGKRAQQICSGADVACVISSRPEDGERIAGSGVAFHPAESLTGSDASLAPDGETVAYILHTSGSTGTPKGVPITHANALSYLRYAVDRYYVAPGARLSATFRLTFDLSVHDMFTAWIGGGTLVLPRGRETMLPATYVRDRGLSHWFSVPSVVRTAERLGALRPGSMPGLRWSLFCGEPLLRVDAEAWRNAAPSSVIENLYGPTELTIACAQYRLPDDIEEWPRTENGTVPIGSVFPHLSSRLDDDNQLLVRGAQRFGGYLDPAHNDGVFVDDADDRPGLGTVSDQYWYRTGDVVESLGDQLVYRFRVDRQIQLQGHRVELADVESALRRVPGVRDAVVLDVPDAHGQVSLVGVLVGSDVEPDEVSALIGADLPRYMVPGRLLVLDSLPLNPNGKLDRRALRSMVAPEVG
jgi:non-ribosomal peptide synthetase component F